jgi:hypothetical protein
MELSFLKSIKSKLMKIKANGGIKAFLQSVLNLQKFTRHLPVTSKQDETPEVNFWKSDFRSNLFVDSRGQLQEIDTTFQNN